MHSSADKRVFHEQHVYVDGQDLADFRAMQDKSVRFYIQIPSTNRRIDDLDFDG